MQIIRSKLVKLLLQYDWEILELQSSILKLWWGIVLLLPTTSFRSPNSPMAALMSENAWGILLTVMGAAHLAILLNGSIKWRRLWLMASIMLWLFICVVSWISAAGGFGGALTTIITAFLIINYWRLGLLRNG